MTTFDIETFAATCKAAMAGADDPVQAAAALLERTLQENDHAEMIRTLEAAIPVGASVGEMIVHRSPELTMLYARVPPRFQSGIHNHTVFACIGQLSGSERNVFYQEDDGGGLRVAREVTVEVGRLITLPPDVVHHIENPGTEVASALHLYGGDFAALMDKRSLWTTLEQKKTAFSFESLVFESVQRMKRDGNADGLRAIAEAIPAVKALIEDQPKSEQQS